MTDQEEKVGRQRLTALIVFQGRLIELETDMNLIYPEGDERHDRAVDQYDDLAEIVDRLEVEPLVVAVKLSDAENAVTEAKNRLVESEERVTEAEKLLSTQKDMQVKAVESVDEAQLTLKDLQVTP